VEELVRRTAPGGLLLVQYLNGERIRAQGRLVAKGATGEGGAEDSVWIRHHFAAGEALRFHSYQLRRNGQAWSVEVQAREYHDYPREEITAYLSPHFHSVEAFDGLSGRPFDPQGSDSLGVRARGRR